MVPRRHAAAWIIPALWALFALVLMGVGCTAEPTAEELRSDAVNWMTGHPVSVQVQQPDLSGSIAVADGGATLTATPADPGGAFTGEAGVPPWAIAGGSYYWPDTTTGDWVRTTPQEIASLVDCLPEPVDPGSPPVALLYDAVYRVSICAAFNPVWLVQGCELEQEVTWIGSEGAWELMGVARVEESIPTAVARAWEELQRKTGQPADGGARELTIAATGSARLLVAEDGTPIRAEIGGGLDPPAQTWTFAEGADPVVPVGAVTLTDLFERLPAPRADSTPGRPLESTTTTEGEWTPSRSSGGGSATV